jgi:hypothetical protein
LFIAAFVQIRSHFCWVYLYGWGLAAFLTALIWIWLFIFFVLRWPGRATFLIVTALAALAVPHIDGVGPQVMAGLRAIGVLRQTQDVLAAYKNQHPAEGFPATAPVMNAPPFVQRMYRLAYTPVRSHPGLPVDDYLLTAQPTRCECGPLSFAISRDGKIHFTTEDRRATLDDKIIGGDE